MQKPLIEIKNLTKFFGENTALKDLNLSIPTGSIYGIIGLSGAGKSTLLRCLTGLETPSAGAIYLNGKEVLASHFYQLRQEMGMVFQHFQLFSSRNAFDNIAYPLEIRGIPLEQRQKRVEELVHLVGLDAKKFHFPSQLSGGEKQRVGIARALAHNPSLLLCDEPTSALDAKTTRSILQLLQKLNQDLGLTIVMITHQLETIKQICDFVGVLSQGKIIEEGKVKEVFLHPKSSITKQLLHLQSMEIPADVLARQTSSNKLVKLGFEGDKAKQPVISHLIKKFDLEINILGGGLEYLQQTLVGSLLVELSGNETNLQNALNYLEEEHVYYEVISC